MASVACTHIHRPAESEPVLQGVTPDLASSSQEDARMRGVLRVTSGPHTLWWMVAPPLQLLPGHQVVQREPGHGPLQKGGRTPRGPKPIESDSLPPRAARSLWTLQERTPAPQAGPPEVMCFINAMLRHSNTASLLQ